MVDELKASLIRAAVSGCRDAMLSLLAIGDIIERHMIDIGFASTRGSRGSQNRGRT